MRCRRRSNDPRHGSAACSAEGPFYRARDGKIMGIFKGLARRYDVSVFWLRLVGVFLLFVTGFWPMVILYVIAGFVLKPEPAMVPTSDDEEEFYSSYTTSRAGAIARLKRKFDALDKRIRRMEDHVTSREYDWDQRLNGSR